MSIEKKTAAERRAMIEECAVRGRRLIENQFGISTVVCLFAGLKPAQRAEIMRCYKKDGTVR